MAGEEFAGAGEKDGIMIWRIEKMVPTPVPEVRRELCWLCTARTPSSRHVAGRCLSRGGVLAPVVLLLCAPGGCVAP